MVKKLAIPGGGVVKKLLSPGSYRRTKKELTPDEKPKLRDHPDNDASPVSLQKELSPIKWVQRAVTNDNNVVKQVGSLMRIDKLVKEFGFNDYEQASMESNDKHASPKNNNRLGDRNRMSTVQWFKQIMKHDEMIDKIMDRFEEIYTVTARQTDIDPDAEPVNILILDGGGMKGYAHLAFCEVLLQVYGEDSEILECFDLFAGTSVGGVAAIIMNQMDTLENAIVEGRDAMDDIREDVFSKVKYGRMIQKGTALSPSDQIITILRNRYGRDKMLFDKQSTPTLAVCCMRGEEINTSTGKLTDKYDPLVLRTYAYPKEEDSKTDELLVGAISEQDSGSMPFADFDAAYGIAASTKAATLCQAMSATAAVPGLVDRVRLDVNGNQRSCADGFLVSNSPVAIAIDEARKLYPTRPLGVVLNFGFGDLEDEQIARTVELVKEVHPGMYFQRIVPEDIMSKFSPKETNLKKIALMEEEVRQYIRTNEEVKKGLDLAMKKIFASKAKAKVAERKSGVVVERMQESVAMANFRHQPKGQLKRLLQRCETRRLVASNARQDAMVPLDDKKQPGDSIVIASSNMHAAKTSEKPTKHVVQGVSGRSLLSGFMDSSETSADLKVKTTFNWISTSVNVYDRVIQRLQIRDTHSEDEDLKSSCDATGTLKSTLAAPEETDDKTPSSALDDFP